MNKNIIIVYGHSNYLKTYLMKMNNSSISDIYITMDDLFCSLKILIGGGGNHIEKINDFLQNNSQTDFLLKKNHNSHISYFYELTQRGFTGSQRKSQKELEYFLKKIKLNISRVKVEYLLNSFSVFLRENTNQLSVSATLNRRRENESKTGNHKEYKNYKAGFLAKNALNNADRNNNIFKEKMNNQYNIGPETIDIFKENKIRDKFNSSDYSNRSGNSFIKHSFYGNYKIENREYTSNAFNSFLESDKKGFENLVDFINDADERGNRYYTRKVTEEDKEMFAHSDLIANCFAKSFIRKLSKASIDWAEQEAENANSPIKKIIFYIQGYSPFTYEDTNNEKTNNSGNKKIDNMNTKNFHHKWRNSNYVNIGSNERNFPITYSELKYAIELMERKKNHHIELVPVDIFAKAQHIFDDF
ncbi:hypothetical protein [Xenorhabdus lircayensis]|uniref:Uncharacterized protein n=1 Tax=Xenorhabdus lircayensis TaxID=2763499 RepID=A0ABS0U8A5_9GAMM|nr:hypothetical protein [Xenorhabdus lircayensis]MBI6550111.1 hypothetical protein [Xenorhabdus lircayensis]